MGKAFLRTAIVAVMLSLFFYSFIFSQTGRAIADYYRTENIVLKRKALRLMADEVLRGADYNSECRAVLENALESDDPTLVAAAIDQIGRMRIPEFNEQLIQIYKDAKERFANMYDNRVRISIINTLALTGRNSDIVVQLFSEILNPQKTKFTYLQGDVLTVIKRNSIKGCVDAVKKYKNFLAASIKRKDIGLENPRIYEILGQYISLCNDILQAK